MRNALIILTAAGLMAGTGLAQETSESVESILKELTAYDAPEARPVSSAVVEKVAPVEAAMGADPVVEAEVAVEAEDVMEPTEAVDVDAMLKESREQLLGGEFAQARQGLAEILKIDPENNRARLYQRTLLERDHRTAEIDGMKAVDAAWSTELVLRSYTLADGARERMKLENVTSSVDVGTLFPLVDFPKDSSAIYQPDTKTIFVRNTQQNLAMLETMLETMEVLKDSDSGDQVEIEAKFVEVSEGTLEELGFQWNFADPTHVGIGGTDLDVSDGPGGLFSDALRGSPSGSSSDLPFSRSEGVSAAAAGNWSAFRFEDTFSSSADFLRLDNDTANNSFDVLISALDQSTGTDVLSAPRIVTLSGEEATIRVGERHYYPEVFEGESDAATMLVVSYQDFEEKLLGVELVVTPEVIENKINLRLNPRITELAGWKEYQLAPENSIYNHRQDDKSELYLHDPVTARLPIFKKREIDTEVTISDGSTIGMGGLISEKIETFEDKVPVLGSLPLVGRLFRNEGERVVKRNLLMFVTAKVVEPNGRISTSRSFE